MQEFTDLVMNFVNSTANGNKPSTQSIQTDLKNYFVGKTTNEKEKNNPFAINLYLLDTIEGGYIWRREENLELVTDYEMAADKYNL